ncbi:MAG: threonylcarbamoyl-AMP synthase, partial [Clostridia bacterium]|nr:threonylcarbamoyl-AMP synthase [Clostridia bacterium]
MITRILQIDEKSLALAAEIITKGGVVGMPTETVYGLGANAFDTSAVDAVFKIKGRPNDNPLIVHVHKDYDISTLVSDIPEYAEKLAKIYLPGPLTMIYKSKCTVSPSVSCGLNTLAVRIPSHAGAQKFLKYVNLPIAAPSANVSKHVSPTSAEHVYRDLEGKIELILDGGECSGGIESTVLDCTGEYPVILRSGLVTREMIEKVVGKCGEYVLKEGEKAKSPGMKYKHYSPDCKTKLFPCDKIEEAVNYCVERINSGINAVIMCDGYAAEKINGVKILNLGKSGEEIAKKLYSKLREGELCADEIVAIEPKEQSGVMAGVMNRLK